MSTVARFSERITLYSSATAVLLGAFALLLSIELVLNPESELSLPISGPFIGAIALFALLILFAGDRAGPWPAILLVVAHTALAIACLTVLENPLGVAGIMLQMPVLGLYLGAFLKPWVARLCQAVVLIAFVTTALWDPLDVLDEMYNGRNLPSLVIFSWLCVEVGVFVQHRFKRTTHIDDLTGLHNRRGLVDRGDAERARADRLGHPIALAVVDLDRFKTLNDTHGHEAGDRVLRALAAQWKSRIRRTDLIARVGGDEFVFLLPGTDVEGAQTLLSELAADANHPWSWGVVEWRTGELLAVAVAGADAAMYRNKAARRAGEAHAGEAHTSETQAGDAQAT